MSYKRQFQAHYHNFINALRTMAIPELVGGRTVRTSLLLVVMILSVAYMVRVNSAATRGYEAHALEKQISQMTVDLQNMQIKIADAGSMNNIEKRLQGMDLAAIEEVQHYSAVGGVVAVAK